jgi:propanol-preferring alcohol dehydrogenase
MAGAQLRICPYCRSGRENLCDTPDYTGATLDGGYASHVIADSRFCLPIPDVYGDAEAAPLLCAGLIGYRALVMAGEGKALGFYGFGAAAHIIAQVAIWQGRRVHAFTRPGDLAGQAFARSLGCCWAGARMSLRPKSWMLPSSLLLSGRWFLSLCALLPKAARSYVRAST